MTTNRRRRHGFRSLALLGVVVVAGCGGAADVAPTVRIAPKERQGLTGAVVSKQISLPADTPFNIHVKQSSQNPGANGTAEGRSDARDAGSAAATVEVSNGGLATADFQIGHAIDYDGDKAVSAAVRVSFKLDYELAAKPAAGETTAGIVLTVYVRDSAGHVYPKIDLGTLSADDAPGRASRTEVREFEFVMQPRMSYQLALHGTASAATELAANAVARIKIDELKMTLAFSEAPPPATGPAAK